MNALVEPEEDATPNGVVLLDWVGNALLFAPKPLPLVVPVLDVFPKGFVFCDELNPDAAAVLLCPTGWHKLAGAESFSLAS